ncbi:MAG: hypothetical protein HYU56_05480 [Candidatus Aenigmarchaeota archaeon]|nr:hypothetical protein [Candidatus Aenigmarchaeota archaeon]
MLFPISRAKVEASFRGLKVYKTHNMFGCYGHGSAKSRWELIDSQGTTAGTFIRWYPFGPVEFYANITDGHTNTSAVEIGTRYASIVRETMP